MKYDLNLMDSHDSPDRKEISHIFIQVPAGFNHQVLIKILLYDPYPAEIPGISGFTVPMKKSYPENL